MPRKKPFSSKQKKKQLQEKRQKKKNQYDESLEIRSRSSSTVTPAESFDSDSEDEESVERKDVVRINQQPSSSSSDYDPNRYRLHFERESKEEIELRKEQARQPFDVFDEEALEVSIEDIYQPGSVLDMPKRPSWNYSMSKDQLERQERDMFKQYLKDIHTQYESTQLSYFEQNLETWRQLWRVLEVSDIVVLITDVRHPVLHFSPALYDYVIKELKKEMVLVLNKIDLVPPEIVTAWHSYFANKFPQIHVVYFTSFPKDPEEVKQRAKKVLSRRPRKKGGNLAVGPRALLEACENITGDKVDLGSWSRHIADVESGEGLFTDEYASSDEEQEADYNEQLEVRDDLITLGLVGHTNVGKSSLLNALVGKKVVSCSRTPGHTKHFQTIFLTPQIRLCDSPGLIFPSLVDRQLQIISGMYPISQVQEPYTAVGYLAARVPLIPLLHLVHPLDRDKDSSDEGVIEEGDRRQRQWSAWDVCDAWAQKRGYWTARAGRHDVYRAANSLLRLAVDGRIVLCYRPPGFSLKRDKWLSNPRTAEIAKLQILHSEAKRVRNMSDEEESIQPQMNQRKRNKKKAKARRNASQENSGDEDTVLVSNNPFALLGDDT